MTLSCFFVIFGMMTKDLQAYFDHPLVLETYRNYNELHVKGFPYLNYFGINFDSKGIASVKFYFAFFHRLAPESVLRFLPHSRDFDRYYHLWDESKLKTAEHTGCTFEIKFKGSLHPVLGFHYRLRPEKASYELIGYPQQLPFGVEELDTRPGINYEYAGTDVLRKQYYYLHETKHKAVIAERFGNPEIRKAHVIEYTESDRFSKINAWRLDHTRENLNRENVFSPYAGGIIKDLQEEYGLINASDGFYEGSDVRASYYFNVKPTSQAPYDDPENFDIDTLKLVFAHVPQPE